MMSRTMLGLSAAAAIAVGTAWTGPATAAERYADGLRNAPQIEVSAQRRYVRHGWRHWGPRFHYRHYGYYPYRRFYPYDAYAYYPYRYRYYAPGPYVRFGPFAFGVW